MTHYNANMQPGTRYIRTVNRRAGEFVTQRVPFKNSNGQLYGHWEGSGVPHSEGSAMRYVVYSYGTHWPLFVWDDASQRWYGNADRHRVTTTKHRTYAHPECYSSDVHWLSLMAIRLLAREGYQALAAARVHGVNLG